MIFISLYSCFVMIVIIVWNEARLGVIKSQCDDNINKIAFEFLSYNVLKQSLPISHLVESKLHYNRN